MLRFLLVALALVASTAAHSQQPTRTVDGLKISVDKIVKNPHGGPTFIFLIENQEGPTRIWHTQGSARIDGENQGYDASGIPICTLTDCPRDRPGLSLPKGGDATLSFYYTSTNRYIKGAKVNFTFELIKTVGEELVVVNVSLRGVTIP